MDTSPKSKDVERMLVDNKDSLRRQRLKKERRNQRRLSPQTERALKDGAHLSLVLVGPKPSRHWTKFTVSSAAQRSEPFCIAGRDDFRRTVDPAVLDATIAVGLGLRTLEPPTVQIHFAITRKALLHGHEDLDQLRKISRSSPKTGAGISVEWTTADLCLTRAAASLLVEPDRPLRASLIRDLNWVRSHGDPHQKAEAAILLARSHIEAASSRLGQNRRSRLQQTLAGVSQWLGYTDPDKSKDAALQILEEVLGGDTFVCVTLPRSRVRLAHAWLQVGNVITAAQAINPRMPEPPWPEDPNKIGDDEPGVAFQVDEILALIHEANESTGKSKSRTAYTRALNLLAALNTSALDPSDVIRVALALDLVSRAHPDKDDRWRASNLLYHLCPDPRQDSASATLAVILHDHYEKLYSSSQKIYFIRNAFLYIDAAFHKMSDGTQEKIAIAHKWLTTSHTYTGATSLERREKVFAVLDYMDQYVSSNDPKRINYLPTMGMALARANKQGKYTDPQGKNLDRLVRYWEEYLALVRKAVNSNLRKASQLANALESTAVAHTNRFDRLKNMNDLDAALQLSREAFQLVGYSSPMRSALTYSRTLKRWSEHAENASDAQQEAIRIQTEALRRTKALVTVRGVTTYRGRLEMDTLPGLLEMTFAVSKKDSAECSELLAWLNEACLEDDYADLMTSLDWSSRTCRRALSSGDWQYPPRIVAKALNRVERTLTHVENPYNALYYIQGLSSIGAVALTRTGSPGKAVEILERGAALRARIQLESQSTIKDPESLTKADLEDQRFLSPKRFKNAHDIQGLAATLDGPLIYLASTARTGLALIVTAHKCRHVWLPALTIANVNRWLDLTSAEQATGAKRQVRGAPGEESPARSAVDEVISEATEALRPLEAFLADRQHLSANIVPIGNTAGIPWTYAVPQPVSINPSATLLHRSRTQPTSSGPRIAITAPSPCHYLDKALPSLENAQEEGAWLQQELGFDNTATGPSATRGAFHQALKNGAEVLHIAAHGHVDTSSWGDAAHLLWADDKYTNVAETTSLLELKSLNAAGVGTVFLAACWGGAPNRTLPDESISFPSAFLAAGVKSVIAPLWPIDDDVAYEFVTAFYESWILDAQPPTIALKQAATEMRQAHPDSSTWAAFMITGHT